LVLSLSNKPGINSVGYKDRFISAVNKTVEMGITLDANPLPLSKGITEQKTIQILDLCLESLLNLGFRKSSDLARQCVLVHTTLQHILRENLNVKSYITIGDRYWSDYIYCETSYEYIKNEMNSPNIESPIQVHVWLTLSDGSILDCTGEAHVDLISQRGDFPTRECFQMIEPQEKITDGYHRPYIIGSEFLRRTGSFAIMPI